MIILNSEIRVHNKTAMFIETVWDGFNRAYWHPKSFYSIVLITQDGEIPYDAFGSFEDKHVFNSLGGCCAPSKLLDYPNCTIHFDFGQGAGQ